MKLTEEKKRNNPSPTIRKSPIVQTARKVLDEYKETFELLSDYDKGLYKPDKKSICSTRKKR
jgi:hypothetical protein